MRALTVDPRVPGSMAVREVPDPQPGPDDLLVRGMAVGVCGTDRDIAAGEYGWAPPGRDRLVIGHESLGRVLRAPAGSGFTDGDLVVGVVRRPDPVPCGACARGEFDMCRNGLYTERGIKHGDGFASELWALEPRYAVLLDPRLRDVGMLVEPASVAAKAWEQVELIGSRSWFHPRRVLVTGAGSMGLLAALLGVVRGLDVHVVDIVHDGPKPAAVHALGATYHRAPAGKVAEDVRPDVVIEASGLADVVDVVANTGPYGIVCLAGPSSGGQKLAATGAVGRTPVLENDAVVRSVSANVDHYAAAAQALAAADLSWLERLITRRIPLDRFAEALSPRSDDIKAVITLK